GKLKTRWSGPFTIAKVFPYGTIELSQANGPNFKVNGHRVKHYFGGDVPQLDCPDCEVSRALSFCLSFTRASHPQLHFENPNVEVYIGRLKLLNDFYVIDMKKDPETPLLIGRGFLETANAVIDCRKAKIATTLGKRKSYKPRPSLDGVGARTPYYARKDFLDCHLPKEWEIARDAEINPFKGFLVSKRMVEFLWAITINLKGNMWESKDLIKNPINWYKPPKNRDEAWHAKIRLIDPDGEEFTKTLQSVPTFRKLSEMEDPREIIDLDHFYDTSSRTFTSGQRGAPGKQRVITCYNCKGEGHMSKQCTKPRRKRDAEWFKDKVLLVQAQENGHVLQEEELEFLADP
nr:reverse transcriptase domain-containing protein [Tanacetum cinerariifolium]